MTEEKKKALDTLIDYVEDTHKDNTVIYWSMPEEIKDSINILRPLFSFTEEDEEEKALFTILDYLFNNLKTLKLPDNVKDSMLILSDKVSYMLEQKPEDNEKTLFDDIDL